VLLCCLSLLLLLLLLLPFVGWRLVVAEMRGQVLFPYTAQSDREVDLPDGGVVHLLSKACLRGVHCRSIELELTRSLPCCYWYLQGSGAWWLVECNGKTGYAPPAYIQLFDFGAFAEPFKAAGMH
jgi:hypothetical protein